MNRRPLVGGNWKMHFVSSDAESYCRDLLAGTDFAAEVVLFPSPPLLKLVAEALSGSAVACGGQDIHPAEKGAHTGDVSGAQLIDAGCEWTLCGHSERRQDHGESDQLIGEKATAARAHGLKPLICIGESADERRSGATFEVLDRQLGAALTGRPEPFALAYEPIWAIGTGETATPEIAQETHAHIRETLADLIGQEAASSKRILYGGSVNPGNAADLIAQPDIDGFLVGGASLDPEKFLAIIRACG
jgi:triosephosphate isomerase